MGQVGRVGEVRDAGGTEEEGSQAGPPCSWGACAREGPGRQGHLPFLQPGPGRTSPPGGSRALGDEVRPLRASNGGSIELLTRSLRNQRFW